MYIDMVGKKLLRKNMILFEYIDQVYIMLQHSTTTINHLSIENVNEGQGEKECSAIRE